jgi:hypothetical protein
MVARFSTRLPGRPRLTASSSRSIARCDGQQTPGTSRLVSGTASRSRQDRELLPHGLIARFAATRRSVVFLLVVLDAEQMESHPAIPPELETVPIPDDGFSMIMGSDGVARFVSHPGIKRDARRLLAALGDVERDLQGTMDGSWMLAMRSSLSVVFQHDSRGTDTMTTIAPGLDPLRLAPDALTPQNLERTLTVDALDQVAQATHWLLYDSHIHWPRCLDHPEARVQPRGGIWVCQEDQHELAPIGQLSPPPTRRRLRPDGTVKVVDENENEDETD